VNRSRPRDPSSEPSTKAGQLHNTEFYASGKRHNESDCRLDPVARQRAHEPGLLQLLESGEN